MQGGPEQDQQDVFVLFSPLASLHVISALWGAAVGWEWPSSRKWKLMNLCFEGGEEERCVLWHSVLIVSREDVCVFRLSLSQTLLCCWTWRQNWGKEMEMCHLFWLNSGDDDNSFLGTYACRDGRLKCYWRHQPADFQTVVYFTLLPPNIELLPLPWIPDLQLYFRTRLITNFLK